MTSLKNISEKNNQSLKKKEQKPLKDLPKAREYFKGLQKTVAPWKLNPEK